MTTFSDTISEVDTSTDTTSSNAIQISAIAESGSANDIPSSAWITSSSTIESGIAADIPSSSYITSGIIVETGVSSDIPSASYITSGIIVESGVSSDNTAASYITSGTITESGVSSDVTSEVDVISGTITESGSAADIASASYITSGTITESGVSSDNASASYITSVTITESGVSSDANSAIQVVSATIIGVSSAGVSGTFADKQVSNNIIGVRATAAVGGVITAKSPTVYQYDGFDHQTAQADLLLGTISAFTNCTGSISVNTPYGVGQSLAIQVTGSSVAAVEGYATYNCGSFAPSHAVLGVMTQSNIFANIGTDIGFLNGANVQIFCRLSGSNILVYCGPVLLSTILNVIPASGWFYLELNAVIAPSSAGSLTISINSTQVANLSAITTSSDGSFQFTSILLGGVSPPRIVSTHLFDDIYVATTKLGSMRVATMFPNANGTQVQFLTSDAAAANWQEVDESAMDSDATYNFGSAYALIDEFSLTALPTTITGIISVKVTMAARKDSQGARAMSTLLLSNASTFFGMSNALTNNYQYLSDVFLLDPNTGSSWTHTAVNAMQIGYTIL